MTIKEYYNDQYLTKCKGKVLKITEEGVIFDKTVAFPEGGGQEGDSGALTELKTGNIVNFTYTTKCGGRKLELEGFHSISVETDVIHHIEEKELEKVNIGDEYEITLNVERRAKITLYHTGIHIVLMAIERLRPKIQDKIFGAKISDHSARLDFRTSDKFEANELKEISNIVNEIIKEDREIKVFPHEIEKEALYWKCDQFINPCGGTHLTRTCFLGEVSLKRKGIGKDAERIIATFNNYTLPLKLYHESIEGEG
jgi:alanyl-tRNA synthetase